MHVITYKVRTSIDCSVCSMVLYCKMCNHFAIPPPSEVCDVLLLVAPSSPLHLIGPFPHSMFCLTFFTCFVFDRHFKCSSHRIVNFMISLSNIFLILFLFVKLIECSCATQCCLSMRTIPTYARACVPTRQH